MNKNLSVLVNGKPVSLTKNNFKASGGEGDVYVKSGTAYKLYHDPQKMIPTNKISELKVLSSIPTILAPQHIITDKNGKNIGFTMPYKNDTEFLCKLFINGFRKKNNITHKTLLKVVEQLREVLLKIHSNDILVVDYNEMNFLINSSFDKVFHIDVDSWQTPSHKATAIMESIRDRQVSNNKFSKLSDWFSWGIIAFQLYTGTHPYKGRHPDYKPKDWMKMMDDGISVFNPKCQLSPKAESLSVIPKGHRRWFESVFEKGERLEPPKADELPQTIGYTKPKTVVSTDTIKAQLAYTFQHEILDIQESFGVVYVVTTQGIGVGGEKTYRYYLPKHDKKDTFKLFQVYNKLMLLHIFHYKNETDIYELTNNLSFVTKLPNNNVQIFDNSILSFVGSALYQYSCKILGAKIIFPNMLIGNIAENSKQIFDNVVVQNIFGNHYFCLPVDESKVFNLSVQELNGYRIIDACHRRNEKYSVVMVIAERSAVYDRFVFCVDKKNSLYTVRKEENVSLEDLNFTVKNNGIFVSCFNQTIEIFKDNTNINRIENINIQGHQKIICIGNKTSVVAGKNIHHLNKK